jgi:hypothetical protein
MPPFFQWLRIFLFIRTPHIWVAHVEKAKMWKNSMEYLERASRLATNHPITIHKLVYGGINCPP